MERRWGFLAPWCDVLRRRFTYRNLNDLTEVWETSHTLEVELPRPEEFDDWDSVSSDSEFEYENPSFTNSYFVAEFIEMREALALLSAVEYVDRDAWKYLLTKHCEVDIGKEGDEKFDKIPARFQVSMDFAMRSSKKNPDLVHFDLVRLCGVHQRQHCRAEYEEALKKVAAMDSKLPSNGPGVDIEIPIKVHYPGGKMEIADPLRNLMDIGCAERVIKKQWLEYNHSGDDQGVASGALRCTFVLEPMVANFLFYDDSTNLEMAETMDRLVLDNVWFSRILALSLEEEEDDLNSRKALCQLLTRVFDANRRSPDVANMNYHFDQTVSRPRQVGSIEVCASADLVPDSRFEAMCSAAVFNQMSKKVILSLDQSPADPEASALWYEWIAYGFFSQRARTFSSTETLLLMISEMSPQDIEAFSAITSSDHPEEELCGLRRGLIDERDATLRAGAPIRWDFDANGEPVAASRALSVPAPIRSVRSFSDDGNSEWVDVMIPGFGRCQVQRHDLTFYRTKAESRSPNLLSVTIAFPGLYELNSMGIPLFLQTAGPMLKSLTLWHSRTEVDENAILRDCPNLDELTLSGGLLDVQFNFASYRASGQSHSNLPTVNWHDIATVSRALSDPTNPFAKCVRRLRVRLTDRWNGWVKVPQGYEHRGFEADLKPFLDILETNRSLEYFDIIVRLNSGFGEYLNDFRKYHLKPIPRAQELLPLQSKIAFLSVFSSHKADADDRTLKRARSASQSGPRCELNQESLSSILAFAATPVMRQVYFSMERVGAGWNDEDGVVLPFLR